MEPLFLYRRHAGHSVDAEHRVICFADGNPDVPHTDEAIQPPADAVDTSVEAVDAPQTQPEKLAADEVAQHLDAADDRATVEKTRLAEINMELLRLSQTTDNSMPVMNAARQIDSYKLQNGQVISKAEMDEVKDKAAALRVEKSRLENSERQRNKAANPPEQKAAAAPTGPRKGPRGRRAPKMNPDQIKEEAKGKLLNDDDGNPLDWPTMDQAEKDRRSAAVSHEYGVTITTNGAGEAEVDLPTDQKDIDKNKSDALKSKLELNDLKDWNTMNDEDKAELKAKLMKDHGVKIDDAGKVTLAKDDQEAGWNQFEGAIGVLGAKIAKIMAMFNKAFGIKNGANAGPNGPGSGPSGAEGRVRDKLKTTDAAALKTQLEADKNAGGIGIAALETNAIMMAGAQTGLETRLQHLQGKLAAETDTTAKALIQTDIDDTQIAIDRAKINRTQADKKLADATKKRDEAVADLKALEDLDKKTDELVADMNTGLADGKRLMGTLKADHTLKDLPTIIGKITVEKDPDKLTPKFAGAPGEVADFRAKLLDAMGQSATDKTYNIDGSNNPKNPDAYMKLIADAVKKAEGQQA